MHLYTQEEDKTTEKLDYALAVWSNEKASEIKSMVNETPSLTGLYNWLKIFNGRTISPSLLKTKQDRADFVHVNVSGTTPLVLKDIARSIHLSEGKMIVNVDQSIDMWHQGIFRFTTPFFESLDTADYIFAVEPTMAYLLEKELRRNVPCFPHPCDSETLRTMIKIQREKSILVSLHRYDKNFLIPALTVKNSGMFTHAIGQWDEAETELLHLYDSISINLKFKDLIEKIASSFIALESHTLRVSGRFTCDSAALGIPCVGSQNIYSQKILFPEITTETNDIKTQQQIIKSLSCDIDFYKAIASRARTEMRTFASFQQSEKNFRAMIKESL